MRIYVTPAPGKAVRQPMAPFERVPAEGFFQIDNSAWRRLQASGDITISDGPPSPAADKAKK